MRYLCLIPARGGSKGIPRKNLRLLDGRPLVCWTIAQALDAATPMQVVVSTDDEEIAEVARRSGAEVPFIRPAHLANDTAGTELAVLHAIESLAKDGSRFDAVVLLQATSPVRLQGTIDDAIAHFEFTRSDAVVGVVPQSPFLWYDGAPPRATYDVGQRPRRQDLVPADLPYRETGSIYVTRTGIYEELGNRLGGNISLFVMDEIEGIDIDTEADLLVAQHTIERFRRSIP